jgi:hypothetical protein
MRAIVAMMVLSACSAQTHDSVTTDAQGNDSAGGGGGGGGDGAQASNCTADGVDLIYVVDEQKDLLSFDPRLLPGNPFVKIGTLACQTTGNAIQKGAATTPVPFSMSIDRDGVAWVLYNNGQLFEVSITTAACMPAGNTVGASSMSLFGMGFSTDVTGGTAEHLFLGGGSTDPQSTPRKLASDDTHADNLTPVVIGDIAASSDFSPELTGTNKGQLFGFFPNLLSPAYVQQIDKTNGAAVGSPYNLGTGGLGAVTDWAFAQWNGVFYIFVTTQSGIGPNASKNSTVRTLDPATGTYTVMLQNVTYFIDGAGVSTCAPAVLF